LKEVDGLMASRRQKQFSTRTKKQSTKKHVSKPMGRDNPVLCTCQQKTFQPINLSTKTSKPINQKNQFGISKPPD
jgi:hypothetical protein